MKYLALLALLTAILACGGGGSQTKRAELTPEATPEETTLPVHAAVEMTTAGVHITNTDSTDFPPLTVKLNMNKWGSDDGRSTIPSIPKGKAITIPYRDFTVGTKRFDRNSTVILTIYLDSDYRARSKLFLCPGKICQPAPAKSK